MLSIIVCIFVRGCFLAFFHCTHEFILKLLKPIFRAGKLMCDSFDSILKWLWAEHAVFRLWLWRKNWRWSFSCYLTNVACQLDRLLWLYNGWLRVDRACKTSWLNQRLLLYLWIKKNAAWSTTVWENNAGSPCNILIIPLVHSSKSRPLISQAPKATKIIFLRVILADL